MKEPHVFFDRNDMSTQEIHDAYYSGSGIEIQLLDELLTFISQELSLPKGKLRPDDRFAVELAPRKGSEWDSGYGILLYALQSQARKSKRKIEKKVATVDDYIRNYSGCD